MPWFRNPQTRHFHVYAPNVFGARASRTFLTSVFSNVGLNNALIENNYCTGQRGWCILLTGGPNVNVQVNHNESVNDSTIGLFVTSNFTLNYNKVINPANTALMLGTADINGQVSFNNLYGGSSSANGISINASLGFANPVWAWRTPFTSRATRSPRSTGTASTWTTALSATRW